MTIFAGLLLGALWAFTTALFGYGAGAGREAPIATSVGMSVVLAFITLFFVLAITSNS